MLYFKMLPSIDYGLKKIQRTENLSQGQILIDTLLGKNNN